jgi:hypothetical protein
MAMRRFFVTFLAFVSISIAQITEQANPIGRKIWSPPIVSMPDELPPSTSPKEILTTVQVGQLHVILEETKLEQVHKKLGGTIGQRGYANAPLKWLCFHGTDAQGSWMLWLESDYTGEGTVNGLALQRIPPNATPDRRCPALREVVIEWPLRMGVGLTEKQVRDTLGTPTAEFRDTLVFDHEHTEVRRGQPLTVGNIVALAFHNGVVCAIQVWRNTTN